ncbi:polysaccharide deacetylase family protein [Flavobacterium sp.]|uniref:polysaccharide deacetylase family protein n=1 Tax=Flavobacterium sp. TaxID=239 RepID=UPI003919B196
MNIPKTIVTYHSFENISNFEKQLQILKKQKNVLVTVDDGDLTFYTEAYPLLVKYKIPAILFIITSLIGTEIPFWWNEIMYYQGEVKGFKKATELKYIPNQERIYYLIKLRSLSDKPLLKQQQLTIKQLLEMQDNGIIIANHSDTHPMFDQCNEEVIRAEIKNTKLFFEANNLKGYSVFAYPNGGYNKMSETVLKQEGIEFAFLFDHKINKGIINPLRISRLSVNDDTPIWKFKLILSGWHSKWVPLNIFLYKILKR